MKPDAKVLYSIYSAWKDAVDTIADVQGLYPTFVTNVISPTSIRVAKTNGVGNVWGLKEEPLISEFNLVMFNITDSTSNITLLSLAIQHWLGIGPG